MASRTSSTAARYIIDEPASPEETQELFGIGDKRAAKLDRWAQEALVAVESRAPSKTASKRSAYRSTKKKATAKR
jgi:hypothetical protein